VQGSLRWSHYSQLGRCICSRQQWSTIPLPSYPVFADLADSHIHLRGQCLIWSMLSVEKTWFESSEVTYQDFGLTLVFGCQSAERCGCGGKHQCSKHLRSISLWTTRQYYWLTCKMDDHLVISNGWASRDGFMTRSFCIHQLPTLVTSIKISNIVGIDYSTTFTHPAFTVYFQCAGVCSRPPLAFPIRERHAFTSRSSRSFYTSPPSSALLILFPPFNSFNLLKLQPQRIELQPDTRLW
jgi:hypothetical protein